MGSFMGFDAFRQAFGTELDPDGNPRIPASWQAAVQNGVQAGVSPSSGGQEGHANLGTIVNHRSLG
jgi:hypothetical protein